LHRIDLVRLDNAKLWEQKPKISYNLWNKMGFSKGTLHYMKKNARKNKSFILEQHVKRRLDIL
jgi:CRISPR-associated protein Cas1